MQSSGIALTLEKSEGWLSILIRRDLDSFLMTMLRLTTGTAFHHVAGEQIRSAASATGCPVIFAGW